MDVGALSRRLRRPWLLGLVLAVNLGGILYGFYYYLPQFRVTPFYLWPLVPDSPFAVLLMTVAVILVLAGRSRPLVNLIGAAAMLKVGVWTAIMLPWFGDHFQFDFVPALLDCSGTGFDFRCADLNTYLFYLHLGMAAEALLVFGLLPRSWTAYGWVLAAFITHDIVDYFLPVDFASRGCNGLFPYTLPCDHLGATFAVTAALSVFAVGVLWLTARGRGVNGAGPVPAPGASP